MRLVAALMLKRETVLRIIIKHNPADTDDDACGKIVVGIKEEGQQPGQKRKVDTDVGTDGPNKRMTTSADDVEQNSKSDEADV